MTEPAQSPSLRGTVFWHVYRRLGKWQKRGAVAALAALIGGSIAWIYQHFAGGAPAGGGPVHAMSAGGAFLVAFILFFWVRSFLKWGAVTLALAIAAIATVSYLTGLNLDTTAIKQGYTGASDWVWAQGKAILGMAASHLSGTLSAGLGAMMGMSRGGR